MTAPDFTISDVLAWARTKPADEAYNYSSPCDCALGQFCDFAGIDWTGSALNARMAMEDRLQRQLQARPQTFGGLVSRIEELVQETPVPPSEWTRLDAYMNEQVEA